MPGFCGNCGSPIAPGVRFCSKCGAAIPGAAAEPAIAATPAPAPPPVAASVPITPAPAPAKGGSSALKIILIIVAVFVFLMLLVAGGCFYVAYRVKQKAHEFSQEMGTNAPAYTGKRNPCLLSASEVSAILREPVQAAEPRGDTACEYQYGSGGSHRLDVEFTWKGGVMAMKLAHGVQSISGVSTFTTVPNVGDEAYLTPDGSGLMMRKGDVMVNIDLRASGVSVDAAEKIAAKIGDRLQ